MGWVGMGWPLIRKALTLVPQNCSSKARCRSSYCALTESMKAAVSARRRGADPSASRDDPTDAAEHASGDPKSRPRENGVIRPSGKSHPGITLFVNT